MTAPIPVSAPDFYIDSRVDSLSGESETALREDLGRLAAEIEWRLNPPDDDADYISIQLRVLQDAIAYVEAQPCSCPADPDDDACGRCHVLGRRSDRRVDR